MKVFKNLFFLSSLTNIVLQLTQVIIIFYIAAKIGPSDFGTFVLYTSFINLFISLTETGISSYIIKEKGFNLRKIEEYYSSLISIFICPIFLIVIILAFLIRIDNLELICLMLLGGFFQTLNIFHKAYLTKELLFKKILLIEFISSIISISVSVILVNKGYGLMSLVTFFLLKNIIFFLYSGKITKIKIKLELISIESLKPSLSYISGFLTFNIINYFSRNFDKLLISEGLGKFVLGQYGLAYRVMSYPMQTITGVINSVLLPKLAKYESLDDMKKEYLMSIFVISCFSFPLMAYLSVNAKEITLFFFSSSWDYLPQIISVLSICGAIQSVMSTVGILYQLSPNTSVMNRIAIINTIIILSSILLGVFIFKSIYIMCWLYLLSYLIIFPHTMLIPFKVYNGSLLDIIKSIYPGVLAFVLYYFSSLTTNDFIIRTIIFAFIFFVFILINHKKILFFLKNR
ncbi:oligosaccharide flippase family protein [Providencia rettgeri]|uniref:oligosaccharide flippase family protein n=1 Tax=Providencia sp. PROV164 TaxID=2949871 RepID=UPI00234B005F|nr:oligosaccharide flippase family protein [Providencia sp. PROV164]ELR5239596.1 oligosaccharide flippase family protein [Providencia rettgeri]